MKRRITVILGIVAVLMLALQATAEEITVVGTGDGVAVLNSIGKAFNQAHPEVTVVVPKSIGSGGGIKAVGNDEYKIGRVARKIKDKEKHYGLSYVPVFRVPTVFVVNESVTVDGLSSQQVVDIFSGKITDWQEVGGAEGKIRVVRREEGDSSLKNLKRSFPGFDGITITEKSKTAIKTPEMVELIAKKAGTIGFGPYDVARANNLKVLKIDGHGPMAPDYPSHGTLAYVFKEANNTGNIKKLIDFTTSPAANKAIEEAGGMPLN